MPFVKRRDGAEIYYRDWGTGPPVVLSHGWPLHGITDTHKEQLGADLLAFVSSLHAERTANAVTA